MDPGGRTEVLSRCSDGRPGAGGGSSASGRKGSPSGLITGEVLVGDCDVITEENITRHDGWSDPEVVGSSSVVPRVGSTALPRSTDTTLVCVDECTYYGSV